MLVQKLADAMVLGAALDVLRERFGSYELVAHWKQGEFHHDVVVSVPGDGANIFIIATNCNGGVKEVLAFAAIPDRYALWHFRCPYVADFSGDLEAILARATTHHWFDPCELLGERARSELREEFRERQDGGGWKLAATQCGTKRTL
jgi:hypothetical protein